MMKENRRSYIKVDDSRDKTGWSAKVLIQELLKVKSECPISSLRTVHFRLDTKSEAKTGMKGALNGLKMA